MTYDEIEKERTKTLDLMNKVSARCGGQLHSTSLRAEINSYYSNMEAREKGADKGRGVQSEAERLLGVVEQAFDETFVEGKKDRLSALPPKQGIFGYKHSSHQDEFNDLVRELESRYRRLDPHIVGVDGFRLPTCCFHKLAVYRTDGEGFCMPKVFGSIKTEKDAWGRLAITIFDAKGRTVRYFETARARD